MATALVQQPTSGLKDSEPQQQQQQQLPGPALFTCLSCQVAFTTAAAQRDHYRTDWHRYNLKRKVAELGPVTAEAFASKVIAQRAKTQAEEQAAAGSGVECAACKKIYSTEKSYNNHLQSKRHKDAAARPPPAADGPSSRDEDPPSGPAKAKAPPPRARAEQLRITEDMTEEEVNAAVDRKIESAPRLQPEDCLFCPLRSSSFEENVEHLTVAHSLFIPDVEYISDLRGLLRHLGEKISVANVCLLCNGRGRGFHSIEAVRGHMIDKSHCKIPYDTEEEQLEIAQFYDFSASYPDAGEGGPDGDDVDNEERLNVRGDITFGEDETELVLPSGARLGHRSLKRYYKQYLREEKTRDSVIINRLLTHYSESSNQYLARMAGGGKTALVAAARRSGMVGKASDIRAEQNAQRARQVDFVTKVGFKGNRQKHFRDELLQ